MVKAMHAYERRESPEDKFVYALDKLMPIFMIFLGNGYTWQQEKITLDQLLEKKASKVALSPEINPYYEELVQLLRKNEDYFGKKKKL